jgi:inorganic pyrophosphatase
MRNSDSPLLSNVPTYGENGAVHAVVEAPKGTSVKPKYDPKLGMFTISRGLPLGLSYPFDWGFVPSTRAPDGDPLDVLILHDEKTWPGVLLACQPLGVVEMDQDDQDGKRQKNDRIIVMPLWHDRLEEFERASELPKRLREEIEQFFLSTTFFTAKNPKVIAWKGRKRASEIIRKTNNAFLLASGQLSPGER